MKKFTLFGKQISNFDWKKIWAVTILAMADVLAMILPFYLKNFFSNIHQQFNITESEFVSATSLYGYVLIPSYLFGGYLADKISLKFLVVLGLGIIGGAGFWYGSIPFMDIDASIIVGQLTAIFTIWGLATGFIFWSALWKLLSQQASSKEQGSINGLLGSINGLFGALVAASSYLVYYLFKNVFNLEDYAFPVLCYIVSTSAIIVCFLTLIFVPQKEKIHDFKLSWQDIKALIGNLKVWLLSLLVLGVYMFQTGLSVFVNYLENSLKVTTIVVFVLGMIRTYILRMSVSSFAGRFADRYGKYILFLTLGLVVNAILLTIAIVIPGFHNTIAEFSDGFKLLVQIVISTMFVLLGGVCWGLVTNRWATINELKIPEERYGIMVSFISLIAFSPDAWFWHLASYIYEKNYDETNKVVMQSGYQIVLSIILLVAFVSIISGMLLLFLKRKENKILINTKIIK